jgi:hypothetical protein
LTTAMSMAVIISRLAAILLLRARQARRKA